MRRQHGFTLLEVLVALAILAAALVGVAQLTSAALRNHTRAVRMETATLLARGKLASLQDAFEKDGFKEFDQEDEGTFEADGHPEVHWTLKAIRPTTDLAPDQLLTILMGGTAEDAQTGFDLASLLGTKSKDGQEGGSDLAAAYPGVGAMSGLLQAQLTRIGEQIKKGVREVRLTVSWKDGKTDESFTVVTHLVVFPKGATL